MQYKIFKAVVSSNAIDFIQEVPSSNPVYDTDYPERLSWFSSVSPGICQNNALIRPSPLSSKSMSIYQSSFILG
jgi:hypothetical protein